MSISVDTRKRDANQAGIYEGEATTADQGSSKRRKLLESSVSSLKNIAMSSATAEENSSSQHHYSHEVNPEQEFLRNVDPSTVSTLIVTQTRIASLSTCCSFIPQESVLTNLTENNFYLNIQQMIKRLKDYTFTEINKSLFCSLYKVSCSNGEAIEVHIKPLQSNDHLLVWFKKEDGDRTTFLDLFSKCVAIMKEQGYVIE